MRVTITPSVCSGTVRVPASKSMAHRALICAALAQGQSRVHGLTLSHDITATQQAMQLLGARIVLAQTPNGLYTATVDGCGGRPIGAPSVPVACGESGSTLRFLIPLFSLCAAPVHFTGEGRLPQRPQGVYAALFAARGLAFAQDETGVTLHGALPPGSYCVDGSVSSQFISGLLFALPLLAQDSVIEIAPPFESRSYVALTLQVMAQFGVQAVWRDAHTLYIPGKQAYHACTYAVEGDASQAAFFAVLAAVQQTQPFAPLLLEGLRADSLQGDCAIFEILRRCGARVCFDAPRSPTPQPVCVLPSQTERLRACSINLADCPDLGPVLMVLGLFCAGETTITNAGRLRIKESDRIAAMENELHKLGGSIYSEGDTVFVRQSTLHAAHDLYGHNDHRIVMALSIAALAAGVPVTIDGAQAVEKSYPHFFEDLRRLGAQVASCAG